LDKEFSLRHDNIEMLIRYTAENTEWVVEYSGLEYRQLLGLGL